MVPGTVPLSLVEKVIPKTEQGKQVRRTQVRQRWQERFHNAASKYRVRVIEIYGEERGSKVAAAEAFEVCEYGAIANEKRVAQ